MRSFFREVISMYAESFIHIRNDLPQIFAFLQCLTGLAVIGVGYLCLGKIGSASGAVACLSLRIWFAKWFSKDF